MCPAGVDTYSEAGRVLLMTTQTSEAGTYGISPMRAVHIWQEELEAASDILGYEHFVGWTLDFNRAFKAMGTTKYRERTVSISKHFLPRFTEEALRDTIRHELAHVHAGSAAGHGAVWRMSARALGARPERTGGEDLGPRAEPLYRGVSASCDCHPTAHRLSKNHRAGLYVCKLHNNPLTWVKTR